MKSSPTAAPHVSGVYCAVSLFQLVCCGKDGGTSFITHITDALDLTNLCPSGSQTVVSVIVRPYWVVIRFTQPQLGKRASNTLYFRSNVKGKVEFLTLSTGRPLNSIISGKFTFLLPVSVCRRSLCSQAASSGLQASRLHARLQLLHA